MKKCKKGKELKILYQEYGEKSIFRVFFININIFIYEKTNVYFFINKSCSGSSTPTADSGILCIFVRNFKKL